MELQMRILNMHQTTDLLASSYTHVNREFILRSHYNAKHGLTDIDIEY